MAARKTTSKKLTQGPNKGDTVTVRKTTKGPNQQGTPWYPVKVTKDQGSKNTSNVGKASRRKK